MADTTTKTRSQTTRETAAVKAAATRKKNATKRSTAARKAAGTRAADRGAAARSTTARKAKASAGRGRTNVAQTAAGATDEIRTPLSRASDIAEKVVLVPVGAALVARDEVVATFEDLRSSYASRTKAKQELNRFERRGSSAVKAIERDAKKTRTRVERELRQRRSRVEKELRRVDQELKGVTDPLKKNVELAGVRIENAYVTGRTAATKTSTSVQERIAARI
ncbi:MAG: hypothetical protein KY463_15170 [Actinobacteria bacterium]|nr:hypothetical protein [Actinomycetota bacterium]